MACIASWQLRPGRNPYDLGSNRASHSGSTALTVRACSALSAIAGIPTGNDLRLEYYNKLAVPDVLLSRGRPRRVISQAPELYEQKNVITPFDCMNAFTHPTGFS